MPSRLIREGILDSQAVNALSFPAEVFYRRLMSVVDDFGRFDGRPAVLRGRLYALKLDTVREADISRWIAECEKAGLIALYAVDAKPYILFHKLGSPRAKESKFPPPPAQTDRPPARHASVNGCAQTRADENVCEQTHTDAPYSGSGSDSDSDSTPPQPPAAAGGRPAKGGKGKAVEVDPLFARFWAAYPRKVEKVKAHAAWKELKPDEALLAVILKALAWQTRTADWTREGGKYVLYPERWLNRRRWEDEPPRRPADERMGPPPDFGSELPPRPNTEVEQ